MTEKVRIILVASGLGTDAEAVMSHPPSNGKIAALLSTVAEAKCLERAETHRVKSYTLDQKKFFDQQSFETEVSAFFKRMEAELVFLLDCIHKMPVIPSIPMYNMYPADHIKHGGKGLYGLAPHIHVLEEIYDLIWRGMAKLGDRFWTYPTVHEVVEHDQGKPLMQVAVEIPQEIVKLSVSGQCNLKAAAEMLQKHVLAYEHLMLPAAVEIACNKILSASG